MSAHAPSVCRNAEHTINTGKTLINFQHTYIQFIIDVDVSVSIFFYLCADIFSHAFQPVILSHMYSFQQKHNFQFLILAKHSIWFGHELIIRVQLFFSLPFSHSSGHRIGSQNEISLYSSNEISGNESNEAKTMTESERQADFNRQKEEMKIKRRKKKRTSSSMQSSTFKGKPTTIPLHSHTHTHCTQRTCIMCKNMHRRVTCGMDFRFCFSHTFLLHRSR